MRYGFAYLSEMGYSIYRSILIISPELVHLFKSHFWWAYFYFYYLFIINFFFLWGGGLIFRGAYYWRETWLGYLLS